MSYTPEHKQRTRQRIVESARKLWKAKGYANISINEIMKGADLTHGGFYAHFKSKADLFAEAMLDVGMLERYRAMVAEPGVSRLDVFAMVLDHYLSAGHRDNPQDGCPLVALGEDVWRMGGDAQVAYSKMTEIAIRQLAHLLDGDLALSRAVLSAMVGAIQLARGAESDELGQQIIDDTKAMLIGLANERLP